MSLLLLFGAPPVPVVPSTPIARVEGGGYVASVEAEED